MHPHKRISQDNKLLTHTQLIELWETYLLQLDSDEDGPPFLPSGVQAEQSQSAVQQQQQSSPSQQNDSTAPNDESNDSGSKSDREANGGEGGESSAEIGGVDDGARGAVAEAET